ncbi:MAG: sugar transferase [Chloroflexi bacterium]|nr:sugar transferase [Chloroflexota bacterium]
MAGKRLMDAFFSLVGLAFSLPLFLFLIALVRLDSQGPAVFCQPRLGRHGRVFTCYKFRTMYVNAPDIRNPDGSTFNAQDDPRITRAGRFLRKISLDELPQLINVIKGDMSLVGPRPDLPDQARFYSERDKKRLLVKPGITGLASTQGRNSIPWEMRRELDVLYVENYSLWLDWQILLRTIPIILTGKGVYIPRESSECVPGSQDVRT